MDAKSKRNLLIVVCVIVIIIICAAAAYVLLKNNNNDNNNNNNGNETQYWYYLDYGSDNSQNGWISASSSDNPQDAFTSTLDEKGITYDIDSGGWINAINDIAPVFAVSQESWYLWVWEDNSWQESPSTLSDSKDTTFFIGISTFTEDSDGYLTIPALDPNAVSGWQNGGPFSK